MPKVLYEKDGRIGRITLNRPEVMNAIDDDLPGELAAAVAQADADRDVHVMVLSGAGKAFCSGYDLAHYAEGKGTNQVVQKRTVEPACCTRCRQVPPEGGHGAFKIPQPAQNRGKLRVERCTLTGGFEVGFL